MPMIDWVECPEEIKPADYNFWIRSTIVYHGPVIVAFGTKAGVPEFSSRRWSVIKQHDTEGLSISIGSVLYKSNFDNEDPYAVHKKYISGEWVDLKTLGDLSFSLDAILKWTGEAWWNEEEFNPDEGN